jgi:MFS family permease
MDHCFSSAIVTGVVLGLYYNTLSVLQTGLRGLGFTRAQFNLYNTIVSLLNIVMPVYSRVYRRFPVRRVMILCGAVISLAPFLVPCGDLRDFYLIALMTGLFTSGVSIMGVNVLLNNWFVEKRGVAIGLAFSGSGVSAALMVPFLTWVIGQYGWQWGYRVLALTGGALLLPTLIFLIRSIRRIWPSPLGAHLPPLDAGEGKDRPDLKQAVKTPHLLLLISLGLFTTMTKTGIQQHTIPYLTDIGYSAGFASSIMS